TTPRTSGLAAKVLSAAMTSDACDAPNVSPSRCWFTRITVARSAGRPERSGIVPVVPPVRAYAAQVGVAGGSASRTRSTYGRFDVALLYELTCSRSGAIASTASRSVFRAADRPTTVSPSSTGTAPSASGSGSEPTPDASSDSAGNGGVAGTTVLV